jgi:hypothetical protein
MATLLEQERANLKAVNQQDLSNYSGDDLLWRNVYLWMTRRLTE